MAIRLTIECGHTSELRAQRTPEGYTHDWQVFVRGVDNAEIHHYIEKGIFLLFIRLFCCLCGFITATLNVDYLEAS